MHALDSDHLTHEEAREIVLDMYDHEIDLVEVRNGGEKISEVPIDQNWIIVCTKCRELIGEVMKEIPKPICLDEDDNTLMEDLGGVRIEDPLTDEMLEYIENEWCYELECLNLTDTEDHLNGERAVLEEGIDLLDTHVLSRRLKVAFERLKKCRIIQEHYSNKYSDINENVLKVLGSFNFATVVKFGDEGVDVEIDDELSPSKIGVDELYRGSVVDQKLDEIEEAFKSGSISDEQIEIWRRIKNREDNISTYIANLFEGNIRIVGEEGITEYLRREIQKFS